MMRTAIKGKSGGTRGRVTVQQSFPSPTGGWNARDALADMAPIDAVSLDNWFPRPSYVEMRGGSVLHATGATGNIKTLATYNGVTGISKLYGYTSSGIYDVSSSGAVGASKLVRTNGKHQWEMFGDGTNNWLIAVNGIDKPAYHDGTNWIAVDGTTSPAITGLTTTDLVNLAVFKGRLLFVRKSKLGFDYLPAGAAGGTATYFDLSGEAPRGGYLVAIAVWTRDAGNGPDDYAVFLTSEGEAIVYAGTNPASATTWAKVGSFVIGKPIGRRCVRKYGADPLVLTENGLFFLSSLLMAGDERNKFAVSYKIQSAFTDAARAYFSTFGWTVVSLPSRDAILVNVPNTEDGAHEQFVMNTITKAWCRFTDWDAEDFGLLNRELYFCKGTTTYKAWTSTADSGGNIMYYGKQAFSKFGSQDIKHPKMFMPVMEINGSVTYNSAIDVDFESRDFTGELQSSVPSGSFWGTGLWGVAPWGSSTTIIKQWGGVGAWEGRWLSCKLRLQSNVVTGKWLSSTVMYEVGSGL